MLRGRSGMEREITRIEVLRKQQALRKDDNRDEEPWHAHARGYTEALRRDDEEECEEDPDPGKEVRKGNKKRLNELYERVGRLESEHDQLMRRINPSHLGDPSILPAGQPENPGPFEMVDPVCVPDTGKAYRDAEPGPGTYQHPHLMNSPDPKSPPDPHHFERTNTGSLRERQLPKFFMPGNPVPATAEFTSRNPG